MLAALNGYKLARCPPTGRWQTTYLVTNVCFLMAGAFKPTFEDSAECAAALHGAGEHAHRARGGAAGGPVADP